MFGITDLSTYLIGLVAIILLPGPNSIYVLSVASRRGVRAGYTAACGVFTGDTVLMVLSAAGAASALKTNHTLFLIVKYAGAAYLAWLAIGMLRGALAQWRQRRATGLEMSAEAVVAEAVAAETVASRRVPVERPFRRALGISLLNPKAILFFVAFFVQFVDPTYPRPAVTFLALGTFVQIASFLYLTLLIVGGAKLAAAVRERKALSAGGTSLIGAVFLGFAVKLAMATA